MGNNPYFSELLRANSKTLKYYTSSNVLKYVMKHYLIDENGQEKGELGIGSTNFRRTLCYQMVRFDGTRSGIFPVPFIYDAEDKEALQAGAYEEPRRDRRQQDAKRFFQIQFHGIPSFPQYI